MNTITVLAVFFCLFSFAAGETLPDAPQIQLAILLDTSTSMDGLIEQTKTSMEKAQFLPAKGICV